MLTKKLFALLAAISALAGVAPAQTEDSKDCPHQRVVFKDAEFAVISEVGCGTNARINIGGATFETRPNRCPLIVHFTPARTQTTHVPDSHTYTAPLGTWQARVITHRCTSHWLFGIIPIDVSSSCVPAGNNIVSTSNNYAQYPCDY